MRGTVNVRCMVGAERPSSVQMIPNAFLDSYNDGSLVAVWESKNGEESLHLLPPLTWRMEFDCITVTGLELIGDAKLFQKWIISDFRKERE